MVNVSHMSLESSLGLLLWWILDAWNMMLMYCMRVEFEL